MSVSRGLNPYDLSDVRIVGRILYSYVHTYSTYRTSTLDASVMS